MKITWLLSAAVTAAFCIAPAVAATDDPVPPPAPPSNAAATTASSKYAAQIDAAVAKYEAFRLAEAEDKEFRKTWLNRLRLGSAIKPKMAATPNFVISIGTELLMDLIPPYLRRSDDESANLYIAVMGRMMQYGTRSEQVCSAFLNASQDKYTDEDSAAVESIVDPKIYDDMLAAFAGILRSGKAGEERVLTEKQQQPLMVEVVTTMMDRFGESSVARLGTLEDPKAPVMQKCQAMAEMFQAIDALEADDRADLARSLFGKEG